MFAVGRVGKPIHDLRMVQMVLTPLAPIERLFVVTMGAVSGNEQRIPNSGNAFAPFPGLKTRNRFENKIRPFFDRFAVAVKQQ